MSPALDFDPDAPNSTEAAVYRLARRGGERVLHIGSGRTTVDRALTEVDGRKVTFLDTGTVDPDSPDWHASVGGETFDTVIVSNVLEQLRDPARLLGDLRRHELLDEAGTLVLSAPNANHAAVLAELLSGDFRYTKAGLLDTHHIRWFTLDSLVRLLETNGFLVTEVHRTLRPFEDTPNGFRELGLTDEARAAIQGLGVEAKTYEYVLLARPAALAARLAEMHTLLQQAEERTQSHRREVDALASQLTETRDLLVAERERMLAETAAGAAELTELERELKHAHQELRKARGPGRQQPVPRRSGRSLLRRLARRALKRKPPR